MNPSSLYSTALLLSALILTVQCDGVNREVYIVYMGAVSKSGLVAASTMHQSMLLNVIGSAAIAKEALLYSYGKSFNGFAAKLTIDETSRMRKMEGVISVLPNIMYNLHTTRSWDFMGLNERRTVRYPVESDIIVGLIDTGVWPESASFSDKGIGPPPSRWKGTCLSTNFTCNNKIIGARFYAIGNSSISPTEFNSPRDSLGHGSHTASTVAGVEVPNTSYFGLATGTARGAVPSARIAVYKACWSSGCSIANLLAAFDDAIADGVDILSVSIAGPPYPYFQDPIAIGSFHAISKGILTVASAGNGGPDPRSVTNVAPWIVTVAASTIDRKFVAKVVLGNGKTFIGTSVNRFSFQGSTIPLIYGGDASNVSAGSFFEASKICAAGSLDSNKVKNSIVFCDAAGSGDAILSLNGIGAIMSDSIDPDVANSFPLPATVVSVQDGVEILDYIKSTRNPIATILPGETIEDVIAPRVVSFSSRGPNVLDVDILKPDLTAPGVDILAAWSPVASLSTSDIDSTRSRYNVLSGTSMSCPHVTGSAAYVKSAHPLWSPAAIKSALMTTANIMDSRKNEEEELAYGAGHINPIKALDPGLVFDASETDYTDFLCAQGYSTSDLTILTGNNATTCANISTTDDYARDLNYPSFALAVVDGQEINGVFHRTVTNVGPGNSTYYATVYETTEFEVKVSPSELYFSEEMERKSFTVTVTGGMISQRAIISGSIVWRDGVHVVRTPIAIYTVVTRKTPLEIDF